MPTSSGQPLLQVLPSERCFPCICAPSRRVRSGHSAPPPTSTSDSALYSLYYTRMRTLSVKPIFHCDAKYVASGVGVGLCPQRQNFALGIPTCWYIGASQWNKANASQWNKGHVYFMYISCIFHVYFMLFVHHFRRWLREN